MTIQLNEAQVARIFLLGFMCSRESFNGEVMGEGPPPDDLPAASWYVVGERDVHRALKFLHDSGSLTHLFTSAIEVAKAMAER